MRGSVEETLNAMLNAEAERDAERAYNSVVSSHDAPCGKKMSRKLSSEMLRAYFEIIARWSKLK